MRKLTVEINPTLRMLEIPRKLSKKIANLKHEIFEKIQSIRLLEMLKMDFQKGITIGVYEITTKDGCNIEDLKLPEEIEVFKILKTEGNKYNCFVKIRYKNLFLKRRLKEFDLDLIWTSLTINPKNNTIISVIGENGDLNKFLDLAKKYGEVKGFSLQKTVYEGNHILSNLTDKQREILLAAKRNGYYNYPREINSDQLSKQFGVSKTTINEHLRKAENRLISQILVGY